MKLLSLLLALCLILVAFADDQVDPEEKAIHKTICPCGRNYDPVCGTNLISYSNRCLLNCARRELARSGRSMDLLRQGNC